jgi:nicotinamide mononucleotide adenylyltransferase
VAIATKKLSELNVQLGVAQDRYSRANEFHFLRTSEERENDLKRALSEIEQIEYQRNELLKFINQ